MAAHVSLYDAVINLHLKIMMIIMHTMTIIAIMMMMTMPMMMLMMTMMMLMIESSKSAVSYLTPNQHCLAKNKTTLAVP